MAKILILWSRLITLIKTSRRTQIIAACTLLTLLILAVSLIFSLRTSSQLAFKQPEFTPPKPSPQTLTRFANHPTILAIEQDLISLQASISALTIQKHPLLPPSLDMKVRIDK